MDIQVLTQPELSNGEAFSLGEAITSILTSKKPKFKTANFVFGVVRPNALEYLKQYFVEFIENKGEINFYVDADKRMAGNNLINELISIGCNVYVFDAEDGVTEFQYRGCFFESQKKAEVYLTSGNLSMNGLFDSFNIVTHITYDIGDEYKEFKNSIFGPFVLDKFHEATQAPIDYFEDESYIKSYADPIPSISEFTNKDSSKKTKKTKKAEKEEVIDANIQIEIDDDVEFLVPVETPKEQKPKEEKEPIVQPKKEINTTPVLDYPTETIYYNTGDALDVENFLFENKKPISVPSKKKVVEKPEEKIEEKVEEVPVTKNKILSKSSDISKTSIFMFEASKITKKGVCAGEIKLPVYLRDLIALFWDWPTKYTLNGEHSKIKSRICTFEVVDTKNPLDKITDKNVKLFQREDESSFSIYSKELEKLDIAETDIIRLIKTEGATDSYYTCEIVRTDSKEYAIWEQFCTQEMKNSKRKYGIM